MPYGGGYSDLSSKINRLSRYNFIKNSRKGAILIEFAFAVPVLFSLIYYVHDLATIKQWHSKLDFSLHCAANMFQNTQNITKTDFTRICYASVIGMFGDPEHNIMPTGYNTDVPIVVMVTCVTGVGDNKCKVNWFAWNDVKAANSKYATTTSGSLGAACSKFRAAGIRVGSTYSATQLDPFLVINQEETKIILEISVYKGRNTKDYDRDYFKLLFIRIYPVFTVVGLPTLMNHSIIFTPKPGTFDPNKPPQ